LLFSIRKKSRAALEGVSREYGGAAKEHRGAAREQGGAAREERFWLLGEPDLAAFYSAITAPVIYLAVLPGYQNLEALEIRDRIDWLSEL